MTLIPEVRWRCDGDPLSDWHVLRPAPVGNPGFTEAKRYVFQKPCGDWSFHVDDEPLPDDPSKPSCWIWEPGFFAGEVTAEMVRADDKNTVLFLFDVAPDASKLGRDVFMRMVNELWQEDPLLVVGSEPATTPNGDLGDQEDPWAAFSRLRRYGPDVLRALGTVRAYPRRTLRSRRDSVPLHQVRRTDRQTAATLLRSSAIRLFAPRAEESPDLVRNYRVDIPRVEETVDSAANRTTLALILSLLRRTRVLGERLQGLVEGENVSATRTSLATRWPRRKQFLESLAVQLKIVLRLDPFMQVQRADVTAAGLTAIAADPVYSRVWSCGWLALRHGVEFDTSTERLWVSPSWEIYERWCFLRVGKLLAAGMPAWGWHRSRKPDRWVGSAGDRRGELVLQPKFPAYDCATGMMRSISSERVPDVVLKVERAGDIRFAVLDAKYRASRTNVLDAMESAHIYQDSLRIKSRRPEGSLLLVPSSAGAGWLEDPTFHEEHRVGIHALSPDSDSPLPSLIVGLFDA
jgi:hypothetical protein